MTCRLSLGLAAAAAFGLWASITQAADPERPRDPWVFRSVLDGRARMLTCELNKKLIVAYDTQTSSLRRAWSGEVLFTGGVYDTRHGPQPKSVGPAYFTAKSDDTAWSVTQAGKTLDRSPPHYLGYRVTDNGVKIEYALDTPAGRATIMESPEFESDGDRVTLVRTIVIQGLPDGTTLTLGLTGGSDDPPAKRSVVAAKAADGGVAADERGDAATFSRDGTYILKSTWSVQ